MPSYFEFEDRTDRLFGRQGDIDYLLERVKKNGITFVTGRPRMGKSWLLQEVGRQLADSKDFIVGYHESKNSTQPLKHVVENLYVRWIQNTTFSKQAKIIWEKTSQNILPRTARFLADLLKGRVPLPVKGFRALAARGLKGLADAQEKLVSSGLKFEPLSYDVILELLKLVDRVEKRKRRQVLVLDAWEQSQDIEGLRKTLNALLNDIENWPSCHLIIGVRHPEYYEEGPNPAYNAAVNLCGFYEAEKYDLEYIDINDQSVRSAVHKDLVNLNAVFNNLIDSMGEEFWETFGGYPGTLDHWRKAAKDNRIATVDDLKRYNDDAQNQQYSELAYWLPRLTGDEQTWAIRLAFFRPMDAENWSIYEPILSKDIDANAWMKLNEKGVLEGIDYPSYEHETRSGFTRRWFYDQGSKFVNNIKNELEKLAIRLATRVREVSEETVPYLEGLIFRIDGNVEIVNSDTAIYMVAAVLLFGFPLGANEDTYSELIAGLCRRRPETKVLLTEALLNLAAIYSEQGEFGKAIDNFKAVIDMENVTTGQQARALINRAITYGNQGNFDKKISDLTTVINMADASVEQKAMALNSRAIAYENQGKLNKQIADLSTVIEMEAASAGQRARALSTRGIAYVKQGEINRGIADYSSVIELEDAPALHRAQGYLIRGVAYQQQEELEKAIEDFTSVVEMENVPDEERSKAHYVRGTTYGQFGENDKRIADFDVVIDLNQGPKEFRADARLQRALHYFEQNEFDKAITDFKAFLEFEDISDEKRARCFYCRGYCYGERGEFDKEIDDYTTIMNMEGVPADIKIDVLMSRATTYGRQGETQLAIDDYSNILGMEDVTDEKRADALFFRGITYGKQKEIENEIADYSDLIEMKGVEVEQKTNALSYRAFAFSKQGDTARAIADYSELIENEATPDKEKITAIYLRGIEYGKLGHVEEEINDYCTIIDMENTPAMERAGALYLRGKAYLDKSMMKKGCADLYRAQELIDNNSDLHMWRDRCVALIAKHCSKNSE